MKTVVNEIIEAAIFFSIIDFKKWIIEEKGRLKEKEKQQIIDAYNDGGEKGFNKFGEDANKYYNETFHKS